MGVTVASEVEVIILCAVCGAELVVRSVDGGDYGTTMSVSVEPCYECLSEGREGK